MTTSKPRKRALFKQGDYQAYVAAAQWRMSRTGKPYMKALVLVVGYYKQAKGREFIVQEEHFVTRHLYIWLDHNPARVLTTLQYLGWDGHDLETVEEDIKRKGKLIRVTCGHQTNEDGTRQEDWKVRLFPFVKFNLESEPLAKEAAIRFLSGEQPAQLMTDAQLAPDLPPAEIDATFDPSDIPFIPDPPKHERNP